MKKKIAIVFYGYPTGTSTLIINLARSFAQRDYDIDIFQTPASLNYSSVSYHEQNIQYIPVADGANTVKNDTYVTIGIKKSNKFFNSVIYCFRLMFYLVNPILIKYQDFHRKLIMFCKPPFYKYLNNIKLYRSDEYKIIFGVEVFGLYAATMLKSAEKQKIVYLNMELFNLKTSKSKDKYLKAAFETFALKNFVNYVTFPNKERADIFLRIRPYLSPNIIRYLPIVSLGEAKLNKGNYFREKFGISNQKKIVLYIGNLIEWAMCLEIVQSVKSWDDEFVLILHSYIEKPVNKDYIQELQNSFMPGRVFLSQKHFSFWELDEILSSADIGLNFYRPKDENFTEIGFSSNKLTQYMKVGLPMISNDLPFFKNFFEEHNCGITISSFKEINDALKKITANYSVFNQNVISTYNKYFRFERYFDKFYEQINI